MRNPDPMTWSINDLGKPTEDCQMPEPVRPENSSGVYHTCSHCGITFILAQQLDSVDPLVWSEVWVNSHDHAAMVAAQFGQEEKEYRRPERFTEFDFNRRVI